MYQGQGQRGKIEFRTASQGCKPRRVSKEEEKVTDRTKDQWHLQEPQRSERRRTWSYLDRGGARRVMRHSADKERA